MSRRHPGCGTAEHFDRRSFLSTLSGAGLGALGMVGFSGMRHAVAEEQLAKTQKNVCLFFLHGGVSQLETWDPKPNTNTGGPFRAIPTSVPGTHICELLPHTAKQMHHMALVRGVNTAEDDHGKGAYIMYTGRRQTPGFEYPYIGAAMSSQLAPADSPLPENISIGTSGGGSAEVSFLPPKYAPVSIGLGAPPNIDRAPMVSEAGDAKRRELRAKIGGRFAQGRKSLESGIYDASFDQAAALMKKREMFDFSKVPESEIARYGGSDFGKNCLMAKRLLEHGVTYVSVGHTNYDTHSENFNFHIEQLGEFDLPFATFISDLASSGLLKHTLVIVMSEFGRTPNINHLVGRDHWSKAWSVALAGCGIQGGAVYGKTNANGTEVIDGQVNGGHLFHTYYRAVGLDPTSPFYADDRPFDRADPATHPIKEILA